MSVTRVLGTDAMAKIVADVGLDALLDEIIAGMRVMFDGHDPAQLATFDRTGFHYETPGLGLIEWMPAMDLGRLVSVKTVGYHPANPLERGEPSVLASTALYDTVSGRLLALCDATLLTALRTGAASALATDILSPPESSTLAVVGCGAQAVTQIHAISRVRPLERVLAYDVNPEVAASLAGRTPVNGLPIEPVSRDDLARIVGEVDILCTATTVEIGDLPVIPDGPHRPWLHINAVGADFPGKREIPTAMLERAFVVPDVTEQCLLEGECQALGRDGIGPDLAALVTGSAGFVGRRSSLTVFDSTGWALEDLVAAEIVIAHAERIDAGLAIEIMPTPSDPYDPYEFVRQ